MTCCNKNDIGLAKNEDLKKLKACGHWLRVKILIFLYKIQNQLEYTEKRQFNNDVK